ncbi:MAG: hypothetical protein ACYCSS_00550 [Sulfuriferula sp.]
MMKPLYIFIALLIFADMAGAQPPAVSQAHARLLLAQNNANNNISNSTYWNGKKVYGTYTRTYVEDNRKTMGTFSGKSTPYALMQNAAKPKHGYDSAKMDQYTTDKQVFNARKKELAEAVRKHNETLDWSNSPRSRNDKRVYVTYTRQNAVTGTSKYGTFIGYGNPHGIVAGNTRVPSGYYHKDSSGNLVDDRNYGVPKLHSHTTDMNEFVYRANDLAVELHDNREDDNEPYLH